MTVTTVAPVADQTEHIEPAQRKPVRQKPVRVASNTRTSVRLVFAVIAGLALWSFLYGGVLSGVRASREQKALYDQLRNNLSAETIPLSNIHGGAAMAAVSIPALGIKQLVVREGTTARDLDAGPGHRPDTPLPGQIGTSVLYGRSVTFGAPFRRLPRLHAGDRITVVDPAGTFGYRVLDVRRPGDLYPAAANAGSSRLVLQTSEGSGWRSGWAPDHSVYVDADLVSGQPQADAGVTAVTADEQAMARTSASLTSLVLWLQGLLLASVFLAWAVPRWGAVRLYVLGLPVILALLWGASSSALLLLPNLV